MPLCSSSIVKCLGEERCGLRTRWFMSLPWLACHKLTVRVCPWDKHVLWPLVYCDSHYVLHVRLLICPALVHCWTGGSNHAVAVYSPGVLY